MAVDLNLTLRDTNLDIVRIVDVYESFIWTDRYWETGDFEWYVPIDDAILEDMQQDYYLESNDSEHVMIIEKKQIQIDEDQGIYVIVSGRSLESILDRRIVWGQVTVTGRVQDCIEKLLDLCIISPEDSSRKISNFVFKASTDPRITELRMEAQYTGDNLLEVIEDLCQTYEMGYKITLNEDNQFVFELYMGENRSYDQIENTYVVFSSEFENINNTNYIESKKALKNVTLIGGEGEGAERKYTSIGTATGLNRRELFTDARDISSSVGYDEETGEEIILSDEEYEALLIERGNEKLQENLAVKSFEGEAEPDLEFTFGKDYFIGDIVTVADAYGNEAEARILEMVISVDSSGSSIYPTFSTTEEEVI